MNMAQYFTLLERDPVDGQLGRRRVRFYFARRNVGTPNERTRIVRVAVWGYGDDAAREAQLEAHARDAGEAVSRPRRRTDLFSTVERCRLALYNRTGSAWEYSATRSHLATRRGRSAAYRMMTQGPAVSVDRDRGTIHYYSHKPQPVFQSAVSEVATSRTPYFGIELEIDNPAGGLDRYTVPPVVADLFYCKEDGSLMHGVELVSHPGTEAFWREQRDKVAAMLRTLSGQGWKSHDAGTCGMHIHVSRSAFDNSMHLYRFLHLIYRNPQHTLAVSQRGSMDKLSRWSSLDASQRRALKAKVGLPGGDSSYLNGRYEAVNMTRHTAEIRIFSGTLRADRFYKNLQFAAAAVEFTRETTALRRVTVANFRAWLAAQGPRFTDLLEYLNATAPVAVTGAAA